MRVRRVAAPAVPAALAAVAEAGVLFVPAYFFAQDSLAGPGAPVAGYWGFLIGFLLAVIVATAFRDSPPVQVGVSLALLIVGIALGIGWGGATANAVVTWGLISVVVAFRVVTLGTRDWRLPVAESFALGAGVLLAEAASVGRSNPLSGLMPVIAVLFFLGSLSSRAASVWLAVRPPRPASEGSVGGVARRPFRDLIVLVGVVGSAMGVAFLLGVPGGAFQLSGGFVYGIVARVLGAIAFVIAVVLLVPLGWSLARLHIHLQPLSHLASVLRGAGRNPSTNTPGGPGWERVVGFVVFALLFLMLLGSVRRRWRLLRAAEPAQADHPEPARIHVPRMLRPARPRRLRRELPADTVRRWYAEALMALERLGVPKPASRTPGEYLAEVTTAVPESGRGFTALTRAYEDVRYGSIRLDQGAVWRLEVERDLAMAAFARAHKVRPGDGVPGGDPREQAT